MPADHVHFNGSVNLADAESVMREIAARVPFGLRRIPYGETGDRGNWIFFQPEKFLQRPGWCQTGRSAMRTESTSSYRSSGWPKGSIRGR